MDTNGPQNLNLVSEHARAASLRALEVKIEQQRKTLRVLRAKKDELQEKKTKEIRARAFDHKILDVSKVQGYTLTDFFHQVDRDHQYYEAICTGQFKISVIFKESKISAVNIMVLQSSQLLEIQKDLQALSNELCPQRILLTIQHFSWLDKFRKKLVNELLIPQPKFFRLHLPHQAKGDEVDPKLCSIRVYVNRKVVLDLTWTMSWSLKFQSLVHSFNVKPQPQYGNSVSHTVIPQVHAFSNALINETYHLRNQDKLRYHWEELHRVMLCSN